MRSRWQSRLKRGLLALLIFFVTIGSMLYIQAEAIIAGAQGYLFGYPLVIMDVTRANAVLTLGPENQLCRVRQFPKASFREVVRPNADTLYTSGFIDMGKGPWVFELPPNDQRYEVMPFMDAWTNVFAAPGTRTLGTSGGRFLLAGPAWQGHLPAGLTLLRSPTQMVWLIGRTQTNGVPDYPPVHRLQDGIKLRALSDWQADPAGAEKKMAGWQPDPVKPMPAIVQMQTMSTEAFFSRLALLMVNNPPAGADAPMLARLARIGIAPGRPPAWNLPDRWSVTLGRWIADFRVAQQTSKPRDLVRGWQTPPATLGNYGTNYDIRAVVAMIGLGANLPQDAMYPQTQVDSKARALDGSHRYRLHFNAGELPPVHAFWSITAYGADDFFIDNRLQRFALGDRDPLLFNGDGSLDLWLQPAAPEGDKVRNWLPVKSGQPFVLNARLYWPKAAALSGQWGMPALERLD
ncbi:MAG: DUF1254 domain-containing protein [Rhodoferax sp.]